MHSEGRNYAGGWDATTPGWARAARWRDWEPTISTLHRWVQIVGKVRLALAPPLNHWWHVALYVTARGLTTSPIPYGDRAFEVDFDFVEHRLHVTDGDPGAFTMVLEPRSVARFYGEFMAGLRTRGIDVAISPHPVEVADAIRFDQDERHGLVRPAPRGSCCGGRCGHADRVFKGFQTGFVGKASPVHFFWGGFDLDYDALLGPTRAAPSGRHPELSGLGHGGGESRTRTSRAGW